MTIPKIIHYCWFGPNQIPELEMNCIKSWTNILGDYKIVLWNEESFNIESVQYVKQAYEAKKYAFVSDYVRFYALHQFGGIYLDTDVEVLKPFAPFLSNDFFIGFENKTMVGTGIIGAIKGSDLLSEILEYYHNHKFTIKNNIYDLTTNVQTINRILLDRGFNCKNCNQVLNGIHLYERDIFCPKKMDENRFEVTDKTVTIHFFSGSWLTAREKRRGLNKLWRNLCRPILKVIRSVLIIALGEEKTRAIESSIRKILR